MIDNFFESFKSDLPPQQTYLVNSKFWFSFDLRFLRSSFFSLPISSS